MWLGRMSESETEYHERCTGIEMDTEKKKEKQTDTQTDSQADSLIDR